MNCKVYTQMYFSLMMTHWMVETYCNSEKYIHLVVVTVIYVIITSHPYPPICSTVRQVLWEGVLCRKMNV